MLILATILLLFLTAAALVVLRVVQPKFRFFWLIAVVGAFLAWVSNWVWLLSMPFPLELPAWQPVSLFISSPSFLGDGISWPLAISLSGLALAFLLTEVARSELSNPLPWAGILTVTALGLLAVTADNPLTILLVWAALDLAELVGVLRAVDEPTAGERAVISFSSRAVGILLVLWADLTSVAGGGRLDFISLTPQAGLLLLVAAGLRLGVFPFSLPQTTETISRRGSGTLLRLTSAASSMILLARIGASGMQSILIPVLVALAAAAAIYAGWMWLRAPDDLAGRPFWVISVAAMAMAAALQGNPVGAAAWGCALILIGGALFMESVQNIWLNRALLIGAFVISGLPYSLTASAWETGNGGFFWAVPLLIAAQSLILAGYVRHAIRPGSRENIELQPLWVRNVYPAGIGLLLLTALALGFFGWEGAGRFGSWILALVATILGIVLVWLTPRFRLLNPIRAHWVRRTDNPWLGNVYRSLWSFYQMLARFSRVISSALEGEGGIMWTLLFLALFISLMVKGAP